MSFLQEMNIKKLLILAIGVFVIVAGILIFIFKTGDKVSPLTLEAQAQVANNQSEEALELLLTNKKELDSEGEALLQQLKLQYYPIYLEEAEKAVKNEDFLLAYDKYKELLLIVPNGQDAKQIEDNIDDLEKLAEKIKSLQMDYDKYMDTFKSALQESNVLLKDFKVYLDQLEVGIISAEEFSAHFKSQISTSNDILNKLDVALTINNDELLSIHKDVLNQMNTQHNVILEAMTLKDNQKSNKISTFKSTYLSIKENQIKLIQKLNKFAEDNYLEVVAISEEELQKQLEVKEEVETEPNESTNENGTDVDDATDGDEKKEVTEKTTTDSEKVVAPKEEKASKNE